MGLDDGALTRVSAYCLRHFFTVNAIEAGISTRQIADALGYKNSNMIDATYGASTRQHIEHLSSVAEKINRKRKKQPPSNGKETP